MKQVHVFVVVLSLLGIFFLLFSSDSEGDSIPDKAQIPGYIDGVPEDGFSHHSGEESIVLFFHADRCSSCVAFEKSLEKTGIPDGMTIYKVDYDTNKELRKQYAVLTQTTFVQLSPQGTSLKKRIGARTIEDVNKQIVGFSGGTPSENPINNQRMVDTAKRDIQKAYFAGGCFRCLEGPFEAMQGVVESVSGYAGGSKETATYKQIGTGNTRHREAVEVTYDASIVSYSELLQTYWSQIDPTDEGGQFADRGYQYTTALYYQDQKMKQIIEQSFKDLEDSESFDSPLATKIEPFTTFFSAEEEHQNYYLKQPSHYNRYKKGSGRAGFIENVRGSLDLGGIFGSASQKQQELPSKQGKNTDTQLSASGYKGGVGDVANLTENQKYILFEKGTEPPFNNPYRDNKEPGVYVDVLDGTPLFSSTDKFDSGTGRPSFTRPISESIVDLQTDLSHGMVRTEVEGSDNKHLGHVFNDGPGGGERYCINSAALKFIPVDEMEALGYKEFLTLFPEE